MTVGLLTGLYSGTDSTVKGGKCLRAYPDSHINIQVRQGCVFTSSLFNTYGLDTR